MHRKIFYYSREIYMMAVALFGSEFTGWRWEAHDVIGIGGLCKVMYWIWAVLYWGLWVSLANVRRISM